MCGKAVHNHPHALESVLNAKRLQKMYDKAVNTYRWTIEYVTDRIKTQKMYDSYFWRPFFIRNVLD